MDVGAVIQKAREEKGWTVDHLAEVMAVHPRWVRRRETGETKTTVWELRRFVAVLGIDDAAILAAVRP